MLWVTRNFHPKSWSIPAIFKHSPTILTLSSHAPEHISNLSHLIPRISEIRQDPALNSIFFVNAFPPGYIIFTVKLPLNSY